MSSKGKLVVEVLSDLGESLQRSIARRFVDREEADRFYKGAIRAHQAKHNRGEKNDAGQDVYGYVVRLYSTRSASSSEVEMVHSSCRIGDREL